MGHSHQSHLAKSSIPFHFYNLHWRAVHGSDSCMLVRLLWNIPLNIGKTFRLKSSRGDAKFLSKNCFGHFDPRISIFCNGLPLGVQFHPNSLGTWALIYFGFSLVKMIDTSVLEGRRESSCFLGVKICNPWWCYFMCWEWNCFALYRKFRNEMSKSIRWKVLCRKRCNTNGFCKG